MKQLNLAIMGIIALLVLAGCGSGGGGGETTGVAPSTPFLGGSNGLNIEFFSGEPPNEVTDGGVYDFQAIVRLRNDGEYHINRDDVSVDLIGFLPEDFGTNFDDLNNKRPEDDLSARIRDAEGNIQDAIVSEVTFPDYDSYFNFERPITGNTAFIFRADVCYKYQTKALTRLCVLRDLVNVDNNDVCDPSSTKTIHSSSSPVQINSFKQTVTGRDKISFSFDVTHTGNSRGSVFKEGDASSPPGDCPKDPRERREKESRVLVTVETGLSDLRCVGLNGGTTGYINLVDGRRTVTCIQELDAGRNDFETNIDITLDFNYLDYTEQEVLVKHMIN